MSVIYEWVKNIIVFYIIMTAVMHLLPKSNYQKYVRFFCGLLLIVMVLTPVLEILFHPDYLLNKISYQSFWQEMEAAKLDVEGMEEVQSQTFKQEYEKAIGKDISALAEGKGIVVEQMTVELSEDYSLKEIAMSVRFGDEQQGIRIEKITLKDNSKEYPKVLELKKEIMEFYQVTANRIQIVVQEG